MVLWKDVNHSINSVNMLWAVVVVFLSTEVKFIFLNNNVAGSKTFRFLGIRYFFLFLFSFKRQVHCESILGLGWHTHTHNLGAIQSLSPGVAAEQLQSETLDLWESTLHLAGQLNVNTVTRWWQKPAGLLSLQWRKKK